MQPDQNNTFWHLQKHKKSLILIWNMIFVHILENYFSHHTDTFLKKVSLFDFRKKWWKNRKKNPKLFIL